MTLRQGWTLRVMNPNPTLAPATEVTGLTQLADRIAILHEDRGWTGWTKIRPL